MTDVTERTVPKRRVTARIRRFRGVLMVGGPVDTYELSDSAAFIFRSVDGTRTVGEIGELVADEYGVPLAEAVADAHELVTTLIECQIMEVVDGQAG